VRVERASAIRGAGWRTIRKNGSESPQPNVSSSTTLALKTQSSTRMTACGDGDSMVFADAAPMHQTMNAAMPRV
jgi:hypothetical protein